MKGFLVLVVSHFFGFGLVWHGSCHAKWGSTPSARYEFQEDPVDHLVASSGAVKERGAQLRSAPACQL